MKKPFTIAIAPDSFKGSLTAMEAAGCIEKGFRAVLPGVRIRRVPMADGGEGTVRAIVDASGGRLLRRVVKDPLGRPRRAVFGVTGDLRAAVIEMAEASGLPLLAPGERNPMLTSTYGTGQLVARSLDLGVRHVVIGIGGSATVDGGMGMARALGARFLDEAGRDLREGGGALRQLARIDVSGLDVRLRNVRVEAACDVANPLLGPSGAARVYGPQKGATAPMVRELEAGLRNLARVVQRDLGVNMLRLEGGGAAGGLGAGLVAFAGAQLRPGVDIVMEAVKLRRRLRGCDLVITGEGRMDGQTVFGKTPAGVARAAGELGIPVIAIAGSLGKHVDRVHDIGIRACFAALEESMDESELAARAGDMLTRCAREVARLFALADGRPVTRRRL